LCLVVRETLAMLRTAGVLRHVETRVQLPAHAIQVAIDRTRLEQVTLNLVKNAIDAMAEQGGRAPVLTVDLQVDPERGAAVWRIADNGCGIPEDKLQTIFDAYSTTKGRDRGTGLGLYVVKQIVDASGGAIDIASVPGEGTTFTLRIPSAPQPFQEPLRVPLTVAP
ncbi:MAG TPA: ATP-binding protein, partial [Anaeromyxobacteraceae bacterium]|nr:ATP-binding protein [Anaeromyxobacteraceae bacterium]